MNRPLDPLLTGIREVFHCLSDEDRQLLYWTVADLKAEAAQRTADAMQDPMCKGFAQGFATLERRAADALTPVRTLSCTPNAFGAASPSLPPIDIETVSTVRTLSPASPSLPVAPNQP